jgi:hypothetical protein
MGSVHSGHLRLSGYRVKSFKIIRKNESNCNERSNSSTDTPTSTMYTQLSFLVIFITTLVTTSQSTISVSPRVVLVCKSFRRNITAALHLLNNNTKCTALSTLSYKNRPNFKRKAGPRSQHGMTHRMMATSSFGQVPRAEPAALD